MSEENNKKVDPCLLAWIYLMEKLEREIKEKKEKVG
jgi:hypothetical protein